MIGAEHDFWERLRRWILPKIGVIFQFLEDVTGKPFYATSKTHNRQFVGRVSMNEERFEKELEAMGFVRNPLASLKRLASTREVEEGSWRRVNGDRQLHVILYDGEKIPDADSGYVYIYAHDEYRWDRYPVKHYLAKDFRPEAGVKEMKRLLDENGIDYKLLRP